MLICDLVATSQIQYFWHLCCKVGVKYCIVIHGASNIPLLQEKTTQKDSLPIHI